MEDPGARERGLDETQLLIGRTRVMLAMIAAWRADRDDEFSDGREKRDALIREIRAALARNEFPSR